MRNISMMVWAGAYFSAVVFFSVIYYGFWCIRPDSFIVNSELNKYPLSRQFGYIGADSAAVDGVLTLPGLVEFAKELESLSVNIGTLNTDINNIDRDVDGLRVEQRKLGVRNEKFMAAKIMVYQSEQVASSTIDVVTAEKKLQSYEDSLTDVEKKKYLSVLAIADMRIEVAELKTVAAKKAEEASNYVLKNMSEFSDPEIVSRLSLDAVKTQSFWEERELKVGELHGLIDVQAKKVAGWREQRKSLLDFSDFVFFSIGISTTTTYGDLVGNSKIVRSLIAVQLFLCVFIMTGFVSSVVSERVKKDQ